MYLLLLALLCDFAQPAPYKVKWFSQSIDHFNQQMKPNTYQQRYLQWDDVWDSHGPIFFYTGNEGDILSFWDNSQFIIELAHEMSALVIFAEHRYYGASWPFGNAENSLSVKNIGFLSVEQALADYAVLITAIKQELKTDVPVVAFGGSYGGMLSGWFRIKYPHICHAALAASAPIPMGTGGAQYQAKPSYFETVTNDFAAADKRCPDLVRHAFTILLAKAKEPNGLADITKEFSLCKPLSMDRLEHLVLWVANSYGSLAMMDYPYPTNFLAPLPAWPIKLACQLLLNNVDRPLRGLAASAGLFYNGTGGTLSCFDIETEFVECADQTGCGTGPGGKAWDYQACSEIIYFPNTNNVTDMFPPRQWTLQNLTTHCNATWGIIPNPDWLATWIGGSNIGASSNIIFSNGFLDPWHGGGFLKTLSPRLVAIHIPTGAHHLDLRGANSADPEDVRGARNTEKALLRQWLREHEAMQKVTQSEK